MHSHNMYDRFLLFILPSLSINYHMSVKSDLTYEDLDWIKLWKNARAARGWSSKSPEAWDKKSTSFAARHRRSLFASLLVEHLPLKSDSTVLDIGSGPGTLALPMAQKCRSVTALDFSSQMLTLLKEQASLDGINNIRTVHCSWEEDWERHDIAPHDITIAARSLGVDDVESAIRKLQTYSRRHICIADRVSPTPLDPEAFKAVGREFVSGPDYIYTLNILYSMGIHPNVNILELEDTLRFNTLDEALLSYNWMIKDINEDEAALLKAYVEHAAHVNTDGTITIHRDTPPRWALICWEK